MARVFLHGEGTFLRSGILVPLVRALVRAASTGDQASSLSSIPASDPPSILAALEWMNDDWLADPASASDPNLALGP